MVSPFVCSLSACHIPVWVCKPTVTFKGHCQEADMFIKTDMKGEMKRKDIIIRVTPKNSTNKKSEDISQ